MKRVFLPNILQLWDVHNKAVSTEQTQDLVSVRILDKRGPEIKVSPEELKVWGKHDASDNLIKTKLDSTGQGW